MSKKNDVYGPYLEPVSWYNWVFKPSTPPEVLDLASREKRRDLTDIRVAVARHPMTLPKTLDRLSKDREKEIREFVAKHPSTPEKALIRLSKDKSVCVRRAVAEYPNTPQKALARLAHDKDMLTRLTVAKNPSTSLEILSHLSKDEDWNVREGVAYHPHTPVDVLVTLSKDTELRTSVPAKRVLEQRHPNVIAQCEEKFGPDWDKLEQGKKQKKDNIQKKGFGI